MNNEQPSQMQMPTQNPVPNPVPAKNKDIKTPLLVGLLVAVLVGGGVYYWMNQKLSKSETDKKNLEQSNSQTQSELSADVPAEQEEVSADSQAAAEPATDNNDILATGQTRYGDSGGGRQLIFECYEEPGKLTNIWARYGKTPDSLTETSKFTDELGLGDAGSFVPYTVFTQASKLSGGTNYYYQCAGTKDGQTIYGGLAAFTTEK